MIPRRDGEGPRETLLRVANTPEFAHAYRTLRIRLEARRLEEEAIQPGRMSRFLCQPWGTAWVGEGWEVRGPLEKITRLAQGEYIYPLPWGYSPLVLREEVELLLRHG